MAIVFLGVGSNLGPRFEAMNHVLALLRLNKSIRVLKTSPFYETEPVNVEGASGKFLNAVWQIDTELEPAELLNMTQEIERKFGRELSETKKARRMDMDILFHGEKVIADASLTIPHPAIQERLFVLKPFCDIAPKWIHPVVNKSMSNLLKEFWEKTLDCHSKPQEVNCAN